jgi:hypothetical protein
MPFLISLADFRDVIIIIYGVVGIIAGLLGVFLLAMLILGFFKAKSALANLIDENVKPTLETVKQTAETVKGTTEFVGDKAVSPIIRTYSMVSGVRKGLSVLTGLSGRKGE